MPTAQSRTTTIAELKRAGYAFDPSRAANWYAGILQSLLSKGHQSDRIDLLAERTLKQMDILTRGNRRAVILEQVEKSIKRLCSLNVLNQYRPDRVRLQPGLPKAKLERYLAEKPVPWESETNPVPVGRRSRETQDEDSDGSHRPPHDDQQTSLFDNFDPDQDEGALPFPPAVRLPRIAAVADASDSPEAEEAPSPNSPDALSDDPWAAETSAALASLLSHEQTGAAPIDPAGTSTNQLASLGDRDEALAGVSEFSDSPLQPLVAAIMALDSTMRPRQTGARQCSLTSTHGFELELEWRRYGEVRAFIGFPQRCLESVLRLVGGAWLDLVVGIDPKGRYGVHRTLPSPIPQADNAAKLLLRDVQVLDDALASS